MTNRNSLYEHSCVQHQTAGSFSCELSSANIATHENGNAADNNDDDGNDGADNDAKDDDKDANAAIHVASIFKENYCRALPLVQCETIIVLKMRTDFNEVHTHIW